MHVHQTSYCELQLQSSAVQIYVAIIYSHCVTACCIVELNDLYCAPNYMFTLAQPVINLYGKATDDDANNKYYTGSADLGAVLNDSLDLISV